MRLLFVVVVLVLCCTCVTVSVAKTHVFGTVLALDPNLAGGYYSSQQETLIGYEIWLDWWNSLPVDARTTRWGEVVDVDLYVNPFSNYAGGGTPTERTGLFDAYTQMAQNQSINYLLGPIGFAGVDLRQYLFDMGVELMIYPADSSEKFYAIPGSFGSPTANIQTLTPWLPYLRVSKAKTVAVIAVKDGVYTTELCQGVIDLAPYNGLQVVAQYMDMPFDWSTLGQVVGDVNSSAIWTQTMDQIIALNPDALAICDYGPGAEFALNYMRTKNWTPGSVATYPLYIPFTDKTLLDYVVAPVQYSPGAKYPQQINFTDSEGYDALVRSKYGRSATTTMADATLAGMLYTNALINSPTNSTADMIATIRTQQIQTFMGTSAMDAKGRHTLSTLVIQLLNSNTQHNIVGPAQAAVDAFIYPMPKWSERKFNPKWGSGVEIAGVVLIGVGFVVSLAFAIFVLINRNEKVIIAASPVFCGCIVFGSWIVYGSVVVWMPSLVSNVTCFLRAWLLPIGFSVMFGALFAKTYRVHKIFTRHTIKMIKIKNWHVALYVSLIVIGQIIISIFMVSITPIKSILHTIDPYRPSLSYNVCTFSATAKAFMGINIVSGVALLAWGTYLIYHIRKIPFAMYDESKVIGFSIYNTTFFAIIILVIQLAIGNKNRDLTFMITAACCFLGCIMAIGVLFGAKLYAVNRDIYKSTSANSGGTGSKRTTNRTRSHNHSSSPAVSEKDENTIELSKLKEEIDQDTRDLMKKRKRYRVLNQKVVSNDV
jgi:gamma-aminobutyric acid type B receptor